MVDSKEGCIQQEHRGNRLLVTPRLLSSMTTGLKLYREQLGCCLASDPPGDDENTSDSKRIFQKGWEKKPLWAGNLWFPTHHSMLIAAHPITTNVNCACSEILTDCLIQPVSYYVNCYSVNLTWGGSDRKASACSVGDLGSIPGSGRSPGEGNGNPLQYSCLENSMDGGAW